jgi:hypothetical protein
VKGAAFGWELDAGKFAPQADKTTIAAVTPKNTKTRGVVMRGTSALDYFDNSRSIPVRKLVANFLLYVYYL